MNKSTKVCSKCKQEKPTNCFSPVKKIRFASCCKECRAETERVRRQKPEVKTQQRERARRRNPLLKEYHREYHKNHIEKHREYNKTYKRKNPDKVKLARSNRYNKLKSRELHVNKKWRYARDRIEGNPSLVSDLTLKEWDDCIEYWDNRCAYCGSKERPVSHDHFIPYHDGGGFTVLNIVPACYGKNGCNHSKQNKEALAWATKKFGEQAAIQIANKISVYFQWVKDRMR